MALPSLSNPRHEERFHRHTVLGKPIEDIAKEDGVSVDTIRRSITAVQIARAMSNREDMERVQFQTIISVADKERRALDAALDAKTKDGNPDHATRIGASLAITKKIEALQPKGRGIQVGVQVNGGGNGSSEQKSPEVLVHSQRATSFEEIMRKLDAEEVKALPESQPEVLPPAAETDGVCTP